MESLKDSISQFQVVWISGAEPVYEQISDMDGYVTLTIPVEDRSFQPYIIACQIIEGILEHYRPSNSDLENSVKISLEDLMSEWQKTDLSSDSVIYSIIRRISRESSSTAKLIDRLVEQLCKLIQLTHKEINKTLLVVIEQAEWIDRPSLRILNRLCKSLFPNQLRMIWNFTDAIPSTSSAERYDDMMTSLKIARGRIFTRIRFELNPLVLQNDSSHSQTDFSLSSFVSIGKGLIADASLSLVTQNYENAYLACHSAFNNGEDNPDFFRVIGLVHANLGLFDMAYHALQKAIELTPVGPSKAHLECLSALLAIKRFYNLEVAANHYNNGLKYVDESSENNRLEKGWLLNGQSFMEVVAASRMKGEEKHTLLDNVLNRELEALKLIEKDSGKNVLYLRFNLYSNISFLLEIKKDYYHSYQCWTKAFARYIGHDVWASKKLTKPYYYRAGMLAWKIGDHEAALNHLKKAKKEAIQQNDRIYAERIIYGYAYVLLQYGQYNEASMNFFEGFSIAIKLLDWKEAQEQAIGCLIASQFEGEAEKYWKKIRVLSQDVPTPETIAKWFQQTSNDILTKEKNRKLTPPKTKLTSYHPSIDLESIPEIDMNAFLVEEQPDKTVSELKKAIPLY
ncbi:hypothetical protein ACFSO0_11955 [Brevibacillus sp. GCM10020057]|uniref:hypothetical protein n=1 Tax=Brevibacillus sp. GCM10020057 TaxID=3317327 RepID=UPI00362771B2